MDSTSANRGRIPGLDGVRAISILLVLVYHLRSLGQTPSGYAPLDNFISKGVFGVSIFFVLSGFLITHLLVAEEMRNGRFDLKDFYLRRGFRILPPAMTYLLVVAILGLLGVCELSQLNLLGATFFFRNLGNSMGETAHYWSLSVEEQFYALWPLFLWMIPDKRKRIECTVALILLAPMWRQINYKLFTAAAVNHWRFDLQYHNLLAGCLLALVWNEPWRKRLTANLRFRLIAQPLALAAIWITIYTSLVPPKLAVGSDLVAECSVAILIGCIATSPDRSAASVALNWSPLAWLGRLSYSLYIWQQLFCVPEGSRSVWFRQFPLNIAMAVCCACLSMYCIEIPFLRLRKRISRKRSTAPRELIPLRG